MFTVVTIKAVTKLHAGQSLSRVVSANVATLAEGVLSTMGVIRATTVAGLVLTVSLLAGGVAAQMATQGAIQPPLLPRALALGGAPIGEAPVASPALAFSDGIPRTDQAAQPAADRKPSRAAEEFGGTVFETTTNKPFAGATVVVRRYTDSDKYQRETKHTSASDGRFVFDVTAEEVARKDLRLAVRVEADGFVGMASRSADHSLANLRDEKGAGIAPYFDRLELYPTKEVWGSVETPEGKPLAGVQVVACSQPEAAKYPQRVRKSVTTDDQGRFRLQVATPGPAFLYVLPERYAASYQELKKKRGDLGTIALETGAVVKGKLRGLKKEPLADRWIRIELPFSGELESLQNVGHGFGRWVKTGKDGEFASAPLSPGAYRVKVPSRNTPGGPGSEFGFDSLTGVSLAGTPVDEIFVDKDLTLTKGGEPEDLELRPVPHVLLTVEATDSKGNPKPDLHFAITGSLDGVLWTHSGGTDKDGRSVAKVPHGLQGLGTGPLRIQIPGNIEVRLRTAKDGPLQEPDQYGDVVLDRTIESDTQLGVVVRQCPDVIVRVEAEGGGALPPQGVSVMSRYPHNENATASYTSGKLSENRFRLVKVPIDAPFTVLVVAEGYESVEKECENLLEGTNREIVIKLRKEKQK
jgi:hypothetical protein